LIRGGVVNRPAVAFSHAVDVIHLEQRLGFFWEPGWQRPVLQNPLEIGVWNFVYFWLHAPLIIALAVWLYFRHRGAYRLTRNAFLISCLIGLAGYATYPVTPPRLMTPGGYQAYGITGPAPKFGFQDTMEEHSDLDYQAESLQPFVNPFAAVPSLHFGWAFLIGAGVYLALRNVFAVLFALAMPVVMFFGVVLTANHFIFDALTGFAVCLLALVMAAALERWPLPTGQMFARLSGTASHSRARGGAQLAGSERE